jgi:hypothetical protein
MRIGHYLTSVGLLTVLSCSGLVTPGQAQETAIITPASAEEATQNAEVFSFLREYFSALAAGEVAQLTRYHPSLTAEQLTRLHDYFAHTIRDLHIRLQDVRVRVAANTASVTFSRTDRFIDRATGWPVEKSIQLSVPLVQGVSGWQMAGLDQLAFVLNGATAKHSDGAAVAHQSQRYQ